MGANFGSVMKLRWYRRRKGKISKEARRKIRNTRTIVCPDSSRELKIRA